MIVSYFCCGIYHPFSGRTNTERKKDGIEFECELLLQVRINPCCIKQLYIIYIKKNIVIFCYKYDVIDGKLVSYVVSYSILSLFLSLAFQNVL